MLDEKDLLAIAALMDGKLKEQDERFSTRMDAMDEKFTSQLVEQEERIIRKVNVIIENTVTPRFDLLAEEQADMKRRLTELMDNDTISERLDVLEIQVRGCLREIEKLKKAQ